MANGTPEEKAAEWRGRVSEKLDNIEKSVARVESNVTAICAKVDGHEAQLEVLKDRGVTAKIGIQAKATIVASAITASAAIVVAILAYLRAL